MLRDWVRIGDWDARHVSSTRVVAWMWSDGEQRWSFKAENAGGLEFGAARPMTELKPYNEPPRTDGVGLGNGCNNSV
ncbi:hypothetical protein ElyMa_002644200 [Elysia marginata]|uniref:Uncharacterized protein n=1 Tax=Elysia marginata TaxID=1093978 RepID=A0AAV4H9M2_9GAST|nr:hypothetical protein ElyMa_002644200 [Elysia marginata]